MRLDRDECVVRLTASMIGALATIDPVEGVHQVPAVFVMAQDDLVIPIDRIKPKKAPRLRRVTNLVADNRASLLVDHRSDLWQDLWWVRADLTYRAEREPDAQWMTLLGAKYPQYQRARSVESLLAFTVRRLTGWSATAEGDSHSAGR